MAETYKVTLRHSGPWAGCTGEETYDLAEFGYTDEEWDAETDDTREALISEFAEQEFWNAGYEYSGEVNGG